MRKVIILLVAVILLAGGLGNLAFAQPVQNQIMAGFHESYIYITEGNSFTNSAVEGQKYWGTEIQNYADDSGQSISDLTLELIGVPAEPPEWFLYPPPSKPEPLPGGTYTWNAVDIPPFIEPVPEGGNPIVHVGYSDNPVTYTPGFDLSRSLNRTVFSNSGIQTLQVTITPHEEVQWIQFLVLLGEHDLVNATIISPTTGVDNDGRDLWVGIENPVKDLAYTYQIKIKVDLEPNAGTIEFMPRIDVWTIEATTIDPPLGGNSVSRNSDISGEGDTVGVWTWSAVSFEGEYVWHRGEGYIRLVGLEGYCKEVIPLSERNGSSVVLDPIGDTLPGPLGAPAPLYADIEKTKITLQRGTDSLVFSMELAGDVPLEPPDDDLPTNRIIYNWILDTDLLGVAECVVSLSWTPDDVWIAVLRGPGLGGTFIDLVTLTPIINDDHIKVIVDIQTIEDEIGPIKEFNWASVVKYEPGLFNNWDVAPDIPWAYWSR